MGGMLRTIPPEHLGRAVILANRELKLDDGVASADDVHEPGADIGEGRGSVEKVVNGLEEYTIDRLLWFCDLNVLAAEGRAKEGGRALEGGMRLEREGGCWADGAQKMETA